MIFDLGVYLVDLGAYHSDLGACRFDPGAYHFGLGVYLFNLGLLAVAVSGRVSTYESLWKSGGKKRAIEKMIVCAGGKRVASLDSVRVGKGAAR